MKRGATVWQAVRSGRFQVLLFALMIHAGLRVGSADPIEYNRDIRPILADNCFACHGADSAARKADLRLDQREVALEFGAIVAGDPAQSELVARIQTTDPDLVMPPPETKKSLTAEQKALLQRWIAEGAEYQPHWSFLPPQAVAPPAVQNESWVKTPIDRFVLAKLEAMGLPPAVEAAPHILFRRLHLDITGLPPKPDMVAAFVADYQQRRDAALSDWIDRLMALPAWGEHRARYWLDAARYGDTHGLHIDNYREMWPYRDWVIRAFNSNQPFDQFTIEQLGGDLLPEPSEDQLIATGFQRCNITTAEGGTIDEENLAIYAADRVQTLGWVYLGLTTNCAQCHDHKFDPLTMKDYYALAAFFRNTTQPAKDNNTADGGGPILVVPAPADKPRWQALPDEIAAATQKRDQRRQTARAEFDQWLVTATPEQLAADVPNEDLVVHLPLNEGAGNVARSALLNSADQADFPISGEPVWTPDGILGAALVIKPESTVDLGDRGDFEKDQGFSFGAWIKPASDGASAGIIARMDEAADYRGWDVWQQGRKIATHFIDTWPNNAFKMVTERDVLKAGEWQHVFVTYNGNGKPEGVQIFINGKAEKIRPEVQTLKPDASIRTKTPLRLGQRSQGAFFTDSSIQDVRIYQRTLTTTEVKSIADLVPLQETLATAPEKRSDAQKNSLFEHYLYTRYADFPQLQQKVVDLEGERETIRKRSPFTHIQKERMDRPAMAHILMRGEYDRPGEQVAAAPPAALHPMPESAAPNRLGLAQWIVDTKNPLTARVTVNRFWQELFGRGLVATTEDFGVTGMLPTHPELLDWLALDFQQNGWQVKRFFKQILMSATYRQAAILTPDKWEKDRDNAFLSRGPRFRMDAEMIRDYALAASGLLSSKMYGPGVKPYQPNDIWNMVGLPGGDTREYKQDQGENLYRRTVYNFWKRMAPPPNMETLNAPSREVCTVRRDRTNTPLQALVTLNDPQFVEAARHLAQTVLEELGASEAQPILNQIGQRILCRPLQQQEQLFLLADLYTYLQYYQTHPDDAQQLLRVGESPVAPQLDAPTLAAWTMICNQLFNLDETLSK